MSNETKRDVFENAVDALADAQASGGNIGHQDANLFMAEYDAALPDDLPVIPEAIARAMTAYRHVYGDDKGLSILLADWQRVWALGVLPELTNVPQLILESYQDKAATVARAWLDGYEIKDKS
ncbi:hypothetical protein AB0Y04_01015 [Loigolactobacillus coryniformis]|uniref:hypothetical protein n=1 Tax=Loigolactobacillus coryniformis TaxID=1610 RepID=UPI003F245C2B